MPQIKPDNAPTRGTLYNSTQISSLFFFSGMLLVFFVAALELLASLSFILDVQASYLQAPAAVVVMAVAALTTGASFAVRRTQAIVITLCCLAIIFVSVLMASVVFDRSFDGQAYHQEAILQLAGGWNPYYDTLASSVPQQIWLTHYPKGSWFQANAFYSLTASIESGKAVNLILLPISWLFVASLLLGIKFLPTWVALAIATLAALNPVSVNQVFSYYVDGQLSSIFISLTAVFTLAAIRGSKLILLTAAALILLLINTKFTGLVYACLITTSFGCASLFLFGWGKTLRKIPIIAAGFAVGVLLIGLSPYVTNTLQEGHIFHPLLGENSIDITAHAKPEPLKGMHRLEALAVSLFSESSNVAEAYTLKPPLHIPSTRELREASSFDTRLGGFGPWFSGAFTIAAMIILATAIISPQRTFTLYAGFILVCLALTTLINPEAWWARYVPQLSLVPLIAIIMAYSLSHSLARMIGVATLMVILANSAMMAYIGAKNHWRMGAAISQQLAELANQQKPIVTYFSLVPSMRARLNEAGIEFVAVANASELPCENPVEFIQAHGATYCSATSTISK